MSAANKNAPLKFLFMPIANNHSPPRSRTCASISLNGLRLIQICPALTISNRLAANPAIREFSSQRPSGNHQVELPGRRK